MTIEGTSSPVRKTQIGDTTTVEVAWGKSFKRGRVAFTWTDDNVDPVTGLLLVDVFALVGKDIDTQILGSMKVFFTTDAELLEAGRKLGLRVGL